MNDDQLKRNLQSIGMACFVKHFAMFANNSITIESAVSILMTTENYTQAGSRTRVTKSRSIIREGRAKDALSMISAAERVDLEYRRKATLLLGANR